MLILRSQAAALVACELYIMRILSILIILFYYYIFDIAFSRKRGCGLLNDSSLGLRDICAFSTKP